MTTLYSYEGIEVEPADMNKVRDLISLYEESHPPPKPPMIKIRTFEAAMDGREFDEVEDRDDEEYKAAVSDHKQQVFRIMEMYFIRNCVKNPAELTDIVSDDKKRLGLFNYIVGISEITEEAVAKAMRKFRVQVVRKASGRLWHTIRSCGNAIERVGLFRRTENVFNDTVGFRSTGRC